MTSLEKRSKIGVDEKRELVNELAKNSEFATEVLHGWTRKEILQILSLEKGNESWLTRLNKAKMVELLLDTVSKKNSGHHEQEQKDSSSQKDIVPENNSGDNQREEGKTYSSPTKTNLRRRRKNHNPSCHMTSGKSTLYCKNLACGAILREEDSFCKRCSCCICHEYDDNKDTSLWLTCNSDRPFVGDSCGLSFHLDCAFKNEKSGLKEDKPSDDLDGCFYCVSCGKTNSLLECWKKQLIIAEEITRVDQLCYRLLLAQKLLNGTKKYIKLFETVEEAVKSLETELECPLTDFPTVVRRGIVNKLRLAPEVKKMCSSALKILEETLLDNHALSSKLQGSMKIKLEDGHASSLTTKTLQEEAVAHLFVDCITMMKNGEDKSFLKEVVPENIPKPNQINIFHGATENVSNVEKSVECDLALENCVKIIREIECSGYVEKNFRQKFLSWYSLKATSHEVNIVKAFIDTFKDDHMSLAEQLIDTFSDCISYKKLHH